MRPLSFGETAAGTVIVARSEPPVILSEAKDHLATLDPCKKILRFAQDDKALKLSLGMTG